MKSLLVSEALPKAKAGPTPFITSACLRQDIDVSEIPFLVRMPGNFRNANLVALSASGCVEQEKTLGATEHRLYHRIHMVLPVLWFRTSDRMAIVNYNDGGRQVGF